VLKIAGNRDISDVQSHFDRPFLANSGIEAPVRPRKFAFISFHVFIHDLTTLGTE